MMIAVTAALLALGGCDAKPGKPAQGAVGPTNASAASPSAPPSTAPAPGG